MTAWLPPHDCRPLIGRSSRVRCNGTNPSLAETVSVSPDGRLVMVDKFNRVWASRDPVDLDAVCSGGGDSSALPPLQQVAHLGPGRALGFVHDAAGNLLVCDSLKGLLMLPALAAHATPTTPTSSSSNASQQGSALPTTKYGVVQLLAGSLPAAQEAAAANASAASSAASGAATAGTAPHPASRMLHYTNDLDVSRSTGAVYFTSSQDIPVPFGPGGYYDTFVSYLLGLLSVRQDAALSSAGFCAFVVVRCGG